MKLIDQTLSFFAAADEPAESTRTITAEKRGNLRKTAASVLLVANAFIWYLYSGRFLTEITGTGSFSDFQISTVWGFNILGTAVSALFGVFLVYRVGKAVKFLRYWMLAGIFLSLAPLVVDVSRFEVSLAFFTAVGIFFGLGMPASLAYFASSTEALNRAKLGGISFLIIFAGVFLLGMMKISSVALNAVVLAACMAVFLSITVILKPKEKVIARSERVSYGSIVTDKPFLLYFVPWVMFSIINFVTMPVVSEIFSTLFEDLMMIENVLAGICVVIFGLLGDYLGRKKIVLMGFILLGIGYASLGLFAQNVVGWCFYTVVDGIAWGAFYATFLMVIWGDIARGRSSEKYYAVGYLPFLFSIYAPLSIGTSISSIVGSTAVFSFASLFLFLAVLPLAYAPETLSEKIFKDRELKQYVAKAQRARVSVESKNCQL